MQKVGIEVEEETITHKFITSSINESREQNNSSSVR